MFVKHFGKKKTLKNLLQTLRLSVIAFIISFKVGTVAIF